MSIKSEININEKVISLYEKLFSHKWAIPVFLLGVSVTAFGLLIPNLGYYMDDWHHVYYSYILGSDGLRDMLLIGSNRPYAAWFYDSIFNLFGYKPLGWHIVALVLRWATVVIFWLIFGSLWGKFQRQNVYISLLFLVYPYFMLQPMAVAYSLHWMGFFLYALSLWLMVIAEKKRGYFGAVFVLIALVAEWSHLVSSEYFSGLELLRPLILWILLYRKEKNILRRTRNVFWKWLPFLLVLAVYIYWRFFLLALPGGDRNTPVMLLQFFSEPLQIFASLFNTMIQDAAIVMFNGWHNVVAAKVLNLTNLFNRYVLLVITFSFIFVFIWLKNTYGLRKENIVAPERKRWQKEMLGIGLGILSFGPLPIWLIGQDISSHKNQMAATRFGLASMLGATLILVVVIDYFITQKGKANIAVALLVALSIGVHLNNAHQYQRSWEKQLNLFQQFTQRVPDLEPNTAIISEGEILFFMGEYPTAYALNTIYSDERTGEESNYWFYAIYSSFYGVLNQFFDGMILEENFLLSDFSGNSKESLIISFEPELEQCLWVLRPEDSDLRLISELERKASLISAIDRIQIESKAPRLLPPEIFGKEIPENWCSYYQKADLARQRGEWAKITSLWEDAQKSDKNPANGFEYIPFIEGYAHQENWESVKKMTRHANKVSQGMASILCSTLYNIKDTTPSSVERDNSLTRLTDYLQCQE
ncbi:MAG: hypothetical protein ISR59_03535 [Anaerolineales bacterium]|uniref:Uncharacterized protein n=1 Tax=Candidatus Desulfolinea nitratireducens TaxID=2841698 RepID=A0A8J6NHW0_9CHLR|nr:hypothetical protein [Candidatus Desulfolinea nitratireducens]MBL6960156.1 hypothetical protein [Anaerolineales bacterium]